MQNLLASGLHSEWGGPLLPQPTCVSHHELSLLRSKLTQAFHFAHLQNSGLQFGGSELQLRSQYSSEVVPLPMHGRNLSMGPSHAAKSKAAAMGAAVLLCAGASLFGLVAPCSGIHMNLECDSRADAGCGRLMDAEGAGRARAAVAARGAPADDGGADGDGREPVRKRRRVGCLRLATRLRMAEAVDAANGGQWPPRRGEELPRALTQRAAGPR